MTTEKPITTGHEPQGVAHPKHYNTHESGVETIEIVEGLSFNLGNAAKYIMRAGLKGDRLEDLRKALFYLDRAHERQTRKVPGSTLIENVNASAFANAAAFVAWGQKIDRVLHAEFEAGRPTSPLATLMRGLVMLFQRRNTHRRILEETIGAVSDEIERLEREAAT